MHPYALLGSVRRLLDRDTILVVDGGDILSFARVALDAAAYLDSGPFGCLGVGVPYAVAAALSFPGRPVVCLTGDGALGLNLSELDTAARFSARVLVIVANNEGWNIERHDQLTTYGNVVGTELPGCRYDLVARGLGVHGARVEDVDRLDVTLHEALDRAPALVDVAVSGDAPSPDAMGGLAGVPDRQALVVWDAAEGAIDRR
jgi:acetolactate synthase-1/2/3 large subunit